MTNPKSIIRSLDVTPATYSVTFRHQTEYKTFSCGICGLILWIALVAVSIEKLLSIVQRNEMYLSTINQRTWDKLAMENMNLKIILQISDSNTIITSENEYEHGLNVTYSQYMSEDGEFYTVEREGMKSEEEYFWLGEEFVGVVEGDVKAGKDDEPKQYFQVQIRYCSEEADSRCRAVDKTQTLNLKLTWDRPILNLHRAQQSTISMSGVEDFTTINFSSLPTNGRKSFYLEATTLNQDQSILPSLPFTSSTTDTWYYGNQYEQEELNFLEKQAMVQAFSFRRSSTTNTYDQRYKKIDTGIAEVLGLWSIALLVVGLCGGGYKNWVKNRKLAEELGCQREGKQLRDFVEHLRGRDEDKQKQVDKTLGRVDMVMHRRDLDFLNEKINTLYTKLRIQNEQNKLPSDQESSLSEEQLSNHSQSLSKPFLKEN